MAVAAFFRSLDPARTLRIELAVESTLPQIYAVVRAAYEGSVAPLDNDQTIRLIVEGKFLYSLEEAEAFDLAARGGAAVPPAAHDDRRAAEFIEKVPKINVVHLVVHRRPAAPMA